MNLLGLSFDEEKNKGYYFGSFELGEFLMNKETGELEIIKKYSNITHAYSYLLTKEENVLIGFQNGMVQYIDWKLNQMLIWESNEASPASIHSLAETNDYFISGHNDGSIKLFDKISGKIKTSHQVAELTVTCLETFDSLIIAGIEDSNKIYCFDIEREIGKWEISLGKGKFVSIHKEDNENIIVYTEKGFKFTIEISTGSIREHNLGHNLTSKPTKLGPWELLGSKNHLLFGNQIAPNMERLETEYSRISSLISLKDGVLVSSLDGRIEFLKKVVMEKI